MAHSIVQVAEGQFFTFNFDQTSIETEALSQPVTEGNALVAFVHYENNHDWMPHEVTVTGGGEGITWNYIDVELGEHNGTSQWLAILYALDVPGGDDDPFVATFTRTGEHSSDAASCGIYVVELSGIASADALIAAAWGTQATPGTSTDAVTTTNANVTDQPAAMVALGWSAGGAPAAGTGFTSIGTAWPYRSETPEARVEHRTLTSTGNVPATFTAVSGTDHHLSATIVLLEASESEPQEVGGTGTFTGGDLEVSMSGVGLVSEAPAQEVTGTGTFSVELTGATFDGLGQSASRKLVLSEADGTEFRNELQLPVTKSNIPFEWYDKWGNTTGEPVVSGVFSLNDGEAIIPLFGTSLSSTQEGTLIAYDSDFGGIYKLAVT